MLMALSVVCSRPSIWFEGSLEAAMKTASAQGKFLLIHFTSPG
jgi:hypothetical protein